MSPQRTLRLTALACLALSLGSGLTACTSTQAAAPDRPASQTLIVTGRGKIPVPQTLARVQLGVEIQDETSQAVQRQLAERSAAVVKKLQANPAVQKLQTTAVSLNPNYSYKDNQQKLVGYTATNLVHFQIDPSKLGTLIDEAIAAGATRVDGVTLTASDEAIAQAQDEAIAAATRQAERQASAALGALNLKQQKVLNIQINPTAMPHPMPLNAFAEAKATPTAAAPMPIVAGQQDIEATVQVQVQF